MSVTWKKPTAVDPLLHHGTAFTVGVFIATETYTYTYTTVLNWHGVIFQVCSNDSSDSRLFPPL